MKTYEATESEIDQRLNADKRRDRRGFCRHFTDDEIPAGFFELQDRIRNGLENEFIAKYGSDRRPSEKFYFLADLFRSERIIVEMVAEVLDDRLIGLIMSYLERFGSDYCVIVAVFAGMLEGTYYLGRFVINLEEIAVESSLCGVWSQRVKLMEIETADRT